MFFKKLQKEIFLLNLFNFVLLIILYFSFHEKMNFTPEISSYSDAFIGFLELKNLLIPFTIIYYLIFSTIIIISLNKLNGRLITSKDYKFYYFSSLIYMILYLIVLLITILICKKIFSYNLENAMTDSPLVFWISFTIIIGTILLKVITYAKIQTRVQYFKTKEGVSFSSYFYGFKTLLNIKDIFLFILLAAIFALTPFILLMYSVFKDSYSLSIISLIITFIFFSTGKLFIYYIFFSLNNKLMPKKEIKQEVKESEDELNNESDFEKQKKKKKRKTIKKEKNKISEEKNILEENNQNEEENTSTE